MTVFYIIILTALDLLTKWAWETYHITPVIYNPGLGMGIPGNNWVKFVLPIVAFPIILYYSRKFLTPTLQRVFLILLVSGGIGNYVGRFSDKGVIDFIPFPYTTYYFNLADVYTTILQIMLIWVAMNRFKNEPSQTLKIAY